MSIWKRKEGKEFHASMNLGIFEFEIKYLDGEYWAQCKELKVPWSKLLVSEDLPVELIQFEAAKFLFRKYKSSTESFVSEYIRYVNDFQSKGIPK